MMEEPIKRGRGRPPKVSQEPGLFERSETAPQKPKKRIKSFFISALFFVLVAGMGFLGWQYWLAQKNIKQLSDQKSSEQSVQKTANDDLIEKVGKITVVPTDERPTVADVSDASKLAGLPLFDKVQNGDKVLSYTKARRQVVYRPSTNQVVTVITLPEPSANTTTAEEEAANTDSDTPQQ